jgi:hypothetical protein
MTNLRKYCIDKLSPLPESMSIVEKILYARECKAVEWLVGAYNELAQREETITDKEAKRISMESAFYISRMRERALLERQKQNASSDSYTIELTDWTHDYQATIKDIFRHEMTGWDGDERKSDRIFVAKQGKKDSDSDSWRDRASWPAFPTFVQRPMPNRIIQP